MPSALIFILLAMLFSVYKAQDYVDTEEYGDTEDYGDVVDNNATITSNESSFASFLTISGIFDGDSTTELTFNKTLSTRSSSNESSTVKESSGKVSTATSPHVSEFTGDDRSGGRRSSTTDFSTTKDTVKNPRPNPSSHSEASTHVGLIIGITIPILLLIAVIVAFSLRYLCKTKNVHITEHVNVVDGEGENVRLQCMESVQQKAVGTEQDPMIVQQDQTEPVDDGGNYIKLQRIDSECLNAPDANHSDININGDQVKPPYTSHTDTAT